jgi:predicted Zn-dependent peptidase
MTNTKNKKKGKQESMGQLAKITEFETLKQHNGDPDISGQENRCQKTVLENGLRIVTANMPGVRSVSMGVLINAGPRDETQETCGLSHLIEHIMFQGTSSKNAMQIARIMDSAGGQMGAFTARDYTCYTATVLDDYRTYALDLLGDILLNSIFPKENMEREKGAILREIDAANDLPSKKAHSVLKSSIWDKHALGRPIFGWPETVNQLTREDLIYFVHKHYLPNRIIVSAAGNLEHSDFVAQVRDCFWSMMGESKTTDNGLPSYNAGVTIEHVSVSQAYFSLGIRAFPYAHTDRYGLHLLNTILGGGISSRLYRRLREEKGLVYEISSQYYAYEDDGVLVIEGSTTPEYLMQVLGLTLIELWKLITLDEPADEEELWKAKMQIRGQHIISGEISNTRMSQLATQELYFGRHITADEILREIEVVDNGLIEKMARESLIDSLKQAAIAVVGPKAPEYYSVSAIEDLINSFQ